MIGKILISSALIVSLMFIASQIESSKSNIKEAKQIQEHYEIIKDIKTQIALRYNINPENITRDDIIAHLPKGENWEKVLLLDREKSSSLKNKEFVNSSANIVINKDEKLKLLALKAKLKDIVDTNKLTLEDENYTLEVAKDIDDGFLKDEKLKKDINIAINFLYQEIVISKPDAKTSLELVLELVLKDKSDGGFFFDYSNINYDFGKMANMELKIKQKEYLKQKIKDELLKSKDAKYSTLFEKIGGIL